MGTYNRFMRTLNGKQNGPLVVEAEEIHIHGMVDGELIVRRGGIVCLHGMVCGNVLLEGGQLTLHGMVSGSVRNLGGELTVYGTVQGSLARLGGTTHVDPKAIVRT